MRVSMEFCLFVFGEKNREKNWPRNMREAKHAFFKREVEHIKNVRLNEGNRGRPKENDYRERICERGELFVFSKSRWRQCI